MEESVKRLLFWMPRILCIAFAVFVSLFALDVFGEGYDFFETILAFVIHLIPTGIILVAPAVWSRDTMPYYQRAALWIAAHTFPGKRLTGDGLDIKPSDNTEMLRALSRDPLVIKETRVDVLYGISNLMDEATLGINGFNTNTLVLYGKNDDIIPRNATTRDELRLRAYYRVTLDLNGNDALDFNYRNRIRKTETTPLPDVGRPYKRGDSGVIILMGP